MSNKWMKIDGRLAYVQPMNSVGKATLYQPLGSVYFGRGAHAGKLVATLRKDRTPHIFDSLAQAMTHVETTVTLQEES